MFAAPRVRRRTPRPRARRTPRPTPRPDPPSRLRRLPNADPRRGTQIPATNASATAVEAEKNPPVSRRPSPADPSAPPTLRCRPRPRAFPGATRARTLSAIARSGFGRDQNAVIPHLLRSSCATVAAAAAPPRDGPPAKNATEGHAVEVMRASAGRFKPPRGRGAGVQKSLERSERSDRPLVFARGGDSPRRRAAPNRAHASLRGGGRCAPRETALAELRRFFTVRERERARK